MAPLVEVRNLKKYFSVGEGWFGRKGGVLKAVDDINFTIDRGRW